jgi:hypothetical protein
VSIASWSLAPLHRVFTWLQCKDISIDNDLRGSGCGQYNNPVRVIAFNTTEGWSRDVTEDIAQEIRRRCDLRMTDPSPSLESFLARVIADR